MKSTQHDKVNRSLSLSRAHLLSIKFTAFSSLRLSRVVHTKCFIYQTKYVCPSAASNIFNELDLYPYRRFLLFDTSCLFSSLFIMFHFSSALDHGPIGFYESGCSVSLRDNKVLLKALQH